MDKELRDAFSELRSDQCKAFNDIRQDQREGLKEIKCSVECLRTDFFNHATESAQRYGVVQASTRSAHHRLDELRDDHRTKAGNAWAMWIAVVSSALAFGGAVVLLYLQLTHGGVK